VILVQTAGSAGARSVDGVATSITEGRQSGVSNSRISYTSNLPQAAQWDSEREVPSYASSRFNDAELRLALEHVNVFNSSISTGEATDFLVFTAADWLPLGLVSGPARAVADLRDRVTAMEQSLLTSGDGDELVAFEALLNMLFSGLGESVEAELRFDVETRGLLDSTAAFGPGLNQVIINSGFYRSRQQGEVLDSGLQFRLDDAPVLSQPELPWSFNLSARAIGMERSTLVFGDENDSLTIFTRIDQNLEAALGERYSDAATTINLERIGMLDSTVLMGAGDDRVRINGAVVDSLINLGEGNNVLILEQPLIGSSVIEMGSGDNVVMINGLLGGQVRGGPGANLYRLSELPLAGELIGGGGADTLASGNGRDGLRDLLHVTGVDQGFLNGLRFERIPTIDLGDNNDVAIVEFNSSLSGQLFGGAGLDRLSFRPWQTPVTLDLDLGLASPVFGGAPGGIAGFEYAAGGQANDLLIGSPAFLGLDGGPGNDVMVLRWTPWTSPWGDQAALQFTGGPGRDLIVLSTLAASPEGWDGRTGLPDVLELDLTGSPETDTLGWLRPGAEGVLALSPSGANGLGQVNQLPIAPLEQLLAGMDPGIQQLAVNTQPLLDGQGPAELILLGRSVSPSGADHQTLAGLPQAILGVFQPVV